MESAIYHIQEGTVRPKTGMSIRKAGENDLFRIAEIFVFAKRVHYRAIFQDDMLCFQKLQVCSAAELLSRQLDTLWVYERGFVQGFIGVEDGEIKQLFVDPLLEGHGVGGNLFAFGVEEAGGRFLWALEQNERALKLYEKHGFVHTGERERVEGTDVYAIRLALHGKRFERG